MKILIIEDSEIYSKLLKKNLEKNLVSVKCEVVKTFKELKNKNLSEYDLFLCDYILPDSPNGEHIDYILKVSSDIIVITNFEKEFLESSYKNKIIDYVAKDDYYTIGYLVNFIKRLFKNRNINVLAVDDSTPMLKYYESLLKKIKFNVFTAKNGLEALNIINDNNIDLVVSDLNMPIMDGEKLLVSIREKYKVNELPVIIVSSDSDKEKFIKTLKFGANDFLKKPFLKEEFIIRVNNIMEIYDNIKKIEKQTLTDPLTGAYNRLFLEEKLESMFAVYENKAVVMLDIDHFKKINDTYGHQMGDLILKDFVKTIKNSIRKTDITVRYGGEEFLIFMPNTSKEEAKIVTYKIKKNISPVKDVSYTFSAGIADEGETLAEMIKIADERLYKAKKEGRNRFTIN